jgi:outer membrane immunogenic protein
MRFFCWVIAVAALFAALAGEPVRAQSWAGPYIGLSAGFGTGHSDQTDTGIPAPPAGGGRGNNCPDDGHYSTRGGLVGGTLGYNWQQGSWVFGIEGDYSWANFSGSSPVCGPNTATPHPCGTGLDALGTLRGRLGYAVGPTGSVLPYVTGGLAVGDVRGWDSLVSSEGSGFRAGWTAGVGVEGKITPQWSVKVEYLHVDLGSNHQFEVVPGVPETVSFRADIFRAGVNYTFGRPVPAVPPRLYTKAYAKAPAIDPAISWSGFYIGGDIGGVKQGGNGISNFFQNDFDPVFANFQQAQLGSGGSSFTGGFHAGYNWQLPDLSSLVSRAIGNG